VDGRKEKRHKKEMKIEEKRREMNGGRESNEL